jgi:hypothetical protein
MHFDSACRILNARIDGWPLLIRTMRRRGRHQCLRPFARDHASPVRGSAHACAGTALCDDGLVVDQSRTKEVRVFRGFKGVEAATALHAVVLPQPGPQMARPRRVGQHREGPFVGVELTCQAHARTDAIEPKLCLSLSAI